MPALSDYTAGTITLTNGSTAFTGAGTGWQAADFREGDTILGIESNGGAEYVVETITGNAAGTLTQPWEGTSGTYTYRMRYLADGARVTAQARELIELLGNGNLQSIGGLTGPGVVVLEGPHSAGIRPFTDFINGVAYDVQVDTLPDRAAYDGQTAGFAVLVSNTGDGRSAIYSKNTNTSGDWSDPAYITGPVGLTATVEAGTTTTLPPGTSATVTSTPVPGGVELDFGIPAGEGFVSRGAYSGATAYVKGDVVLSNNSSWIAKIATTGNAPPALPTTSNTQWQLLAAKGADGIGTGDVVGPASAVADRIAVFSGTTGKLIKDGGQTIASLTPNMAAATVKGRAVGAGTGAPTDLTAAQVLAITQSAGGYGRSNVLGTVSQSAGVPTGAIIESGSNANGEYVRFADGTQECWGVYTLLTDVTVANALAGGFRSGIVSIPLPAGFANANYVPLANRYSGDSVFAASAFATSSSDVTLILLRITSGTVTAGTELAWKATGRWF